MRQRYTNTPAGTPDHAALRAEPGPLTGQLSLLVAMVAFIGCGLCPLFSA